MAHATLTARSVTGPPKPVWRRRRQRRLQHRVGRLRRLCRRLEKLNYTCAIQRSCQLQRAPAATALATTPTTTTATMSSGVVADVINSLAMIYILMHQWRRFSLLFGSLSRTRTRSHSPRPRPQRQLFLARRPSLRICSRSRRRRRRPPYIMVQLERFIAFAGADANAEFHCFSSSSFILANGGRGGAPKLCLCAGTQTQ